MSARTDPLLEAVRQAWARETPGDPGVAAEIGHALAHTAVLPPGEPREGASNPAAQRHLGTAIVEALTGPLAGVAAALDPVGQLLPWLYSYPDPAPHLAENIAFAELVGPRGVYRSAAVRIGFTLIGPRLYYPPHRHPAVELYHLVAGRSVWEVDGTSRAVEPAAFILHPSNASHAMQAGATPLLAIYAWSGDIQPPSTYD